MLTWLFDLDNTLHNTSHAIFGHINQGMTRYIQTTLQLDEAAANQLRRDYWLRYGATLLGLVRHHQINAADFLAQAHTFDDLPALIRAETGLRQHVSRLPGRKILLTNAPHQYALSVLAHLRLTSHFYQHIAIEHMVVHRQCRPKPSRALLRRVLSQRHLIPQQCVLVEDSLDNLRSARALGMKTVWIRGYLPVTHPARSGKPSYVDVRLNSVRDLPRALQRLKAVKPSRPSLDRHR